LVVPVGLSNARPAISFQQDTDSIKPDTDVLTLTATPQNLQLCRWSHFPSIVASLVRTTS